MAQFGFFLTDKQRWTVVRVWRNLVADAGTQAIEAAQPGDHDEVRVTAQHSGRDAPAVLYYTREELELLLVGVSITLADTERVLSVAESEVIRTDAKRRWSVLNSLRTSLAEARYGLMSQEEIDAEAAAQAEARAAGMLPGE